jgi:hypothetical protein
VSQPDADILDPARRGIVDHPPHVLVFHHAVRERAARPQIVRNDPRQRAQAEDDRPQPWSHPSERAASVGEDRGQGGHEERHQSDRPFGEQSPRDASVEHRHESWGPGTLGGGKIRPECPGEPRHQHRIGQNAVPPEEVRGRRDEEEPGQEPGGPAPEQMPDGHDGPHRGDRGEDGGHAGGVLGHASARQRERGDAPDIELGLVEIGPLPHLGHEPSAVLHHVPREHGKARLVLRPERTATRRDGGQEQGEEQDGRRGERRAGGARQSSSSSTNSSPWRHTPEKVRRCKAQGPYRSRAAR